MNYSEVATALRQIGFKRLRETGPVRQSYSMVTVRNGLSSFTRFSGPVFFKGPPASEVGGSVLKARVQKQLTGVDTREVFLEVKRRAFGNYPKFRDHWVVSIRPIRPRH